MVFFLLHRYRKARAWPVIHTERAGTTGEAADLYEELTRRGVRAKVTPLPRAVPPAQQVRIFWRDIDRAKPVVIDWVARHPETPVAQARPS